MAPIRRYLRITRYSVLEVRIYLDNPALGNSWLLSSRDPVLPRVIEAIRPLVLPKLREENENAKKKGKKKRGVRDVVVKDDFEVSIFLTETSTQHAMLTKQKTFEEKPRMKSNTGKLTAYMNTEENPIRVDEDEVPRVLREEDEDEDVRLEDIPEISETKRKKRQRGSDDDDDDAIFVRSDEDVDGDGDGGDQEEEVLRPRQRQKRKKVRDEVVRVGETDDKKKMGISTAYEGFSIYGRILCLIVKRRGGGGVGGGKKGSGEGAKGSQMLENWVSTQADNEAIGDDD